MNKVILMGRLTNDPDMRGDGDSKAAKYTLAVGRAYKKEETDFISCVSFSKQAEFCEKYLKKGTKVLVSGRIQTGSYTNKDGQKVYTTDVVTETIEFAESKTEKSEGKDEDFMTVTKEMAKDMPF